MDESDTLCAGGSLAVQLGLMRGPHLANAGSPSGGSRRTVGPGSDSEGTRPSIAANLSTNILRHWTSRLRKLARVSQFSGRCHPATGSAAGVPGTGVGVSAGPVWPLFPEEKCHH